MLAGAAGDLRHAPASPSAPTARPTVPAGRPRRLDPAAGRRARTRSSSFPAARRLTRSTTSMSTSPRRPTRPSRLCGTPARRRLHRALCRRPAPACPQLGTDRRPRRHRRPADVPRWPIATSATAMRRWSGNYTVSSRRRRGRPLVRAAQRHRRHAVTFVQESTYQPDTTWRWMGSAAMDSSGDMALGFSASSSTIFPQIRYAGRLATDPLSSWPRARRRCSPAPAARPARQPLGRLQRPDGRPGRRLHLLVHPGVLPDGQLEDAHRQLQVPLLREPAGANVTISKSADDPSVLQGGQAGFSVSS